MELIGEGRTARIYRDGDRAVKVFADAPIEWARHEARNQTFAHEAGLPVPRIHRVFQAETGPALEMDIAAGDFIVRRGMGREERGHALSLLAGLQHRVHLQSGEGLQGLNERLAGQIERLECLGGAVKEALLSQLERLDTGKKQLCHGDFHPFNVLRDGDVLSILDWMDATAGDPLADACRSYLILSQEAVRLSGVYLRLYCEAAGVQKQQVLAWLPIVAAARLSEGLGPKARQSLLQIISDWEDGFKV